MIDEEARRVWLRALGRWVPIARFTQELMQEQLGEAAGLSRSFRVSGRARSDVSLLLL